MGNITRDIEIANENFNKKLLFKEDIENVIENLRKSKPDNRHTKVMQLIEMFDAYGIACERSWTAEKFSEALCNSDIPSVIQLPEYCWGEIVKLYNSYKHPKDYMERLVNNLVLPRYDARGTSTKVKILKQLLGNLNYLEGTRFYDEKLIDIINAEYGGVIEDIDEEIFNKYLTAGHIEETHKMLEAIIEIYSDMLYDAEEYDENLGALIAKYDESFQNKKACEILGFIYENNHRDREKGVSYYAMNEKQPLLVKELYQYLQERLVTKKTELDCVIKKLDEEKDRKSQIAYMKQVIESAKYGWHFWDDDFRKFVCEHSGEKIDSGISEIEFFEVLSGIMERKPKKIAKINDSVIESLKLYKKTKQKLFDGAKDRSRKKVKSPELLRVCRDLADGRFKTVREWDEWQQKHFEQLSCETENSSIFSDDDFELLSFSDSHATVSLGKGGLTLYPDRLICAGEEWNIEEIGGMALHGNQKINLSAGEKDYEIVPLKTCCTRKYLTAFNALRREKHGLLSS